MGKRCAYGTCNSDERYNYKPHMEGVRFIMFPKPWREIEKCKRWVHLCGRKNFTVNNVTKNTYICSKHFVGGMGPTKEHPEPISALKETDELVVQRRLIVKFDPPPTKRRKVLISDHDHEQQEAIEQQEITEQQEIIEAIESSHKCVETQTVVGSSMG